MSGNLQYYYNYCARLGWCQIEEHYVQVCPLQFQSLDRPVLIDSEGIAVFSYGTALSLVLFFAPSNVEIDFLNPFEGCLM